MGHARCPGDGRLHRPRRPAAGSLTPTASPTEQRQAPGIRLFNRTRSPRSNVMLSYEGAVKLLDFRDRQGARRRAGDHQERRDEEGSAPTWRPSRPKGTTSTIGASIFAAEIVLHEVLTGRRLFKGNNDATDDRGRRAPLRGAASLAAGTWRCAAGAGRDHPEVALQRNGSIAGPTPPTIQRTPSTTSSTSSRYQPRPPGAAAL